MVAVVSVLVFAGALLVAVSVIVASVAPQWQRIARLAMGNVEPAFAPLSQLASAERRIAVRRWASAPTGVDARPLRAAA